jgi:ATP-dependent DNA ligase/intein/homing endonuclease
MQYSELCKVYEKLEATKKGLEKTKILSEFLSNAKKEPELIYLLQGRIFPDYDTREIGISEQLAIKAIAKASGIDEKEVVKKFKEKGDLGKAAEEIIKSKKQSSLFSKNLTTEKILSNLRKLPAMEGKGTVENKIALIVELLHSASPTEARYLMRTILGDLKVGIGNGQIRDSIIDFCFHPKDISEKKEKSEIIQSAYDRALDFACVFEKSCSNNLHDISLSPGKPVKVMLYPKAQNIADAFEIVGRPMACFPKGELIFVNNSIKKIEELNKKDKVVGKDGKLQEIKETFDRDYNGKIVRIYLHYLFPFSLTSDHKVLCIKNSLCSWKNRKIVCRPNCQEQKYGCKRNYKNYFPNWIDSNNLNKGDFLLFPKFREEHLIDKLNLKNYNTHKDLGEEEGKIFGNSKIEGSFKGDKINKFVKLDKDSFELFGWYLAEGSFDRSGIKFTLGLKEEEEAERIKELIKKVFDINSSISKRKSIIEIRACSVLLPQFFKENFNSCSTNKKIPDFVMNSKKELIREFIKSYIEGDGHKSKQDCYIIATASQTIAYQLILLLNKLNILPSVLKTKNKGFGDIIYKISIFGKQINNIENNSHKTKTNHQRFFEDENFFYIPIKKIEYKNYSGKVFNLETEDNAYLSSCIVHNCEFKYDGFRMLINKDEKGVIKIFTRRLENVSKQFPDAEKYAKEYIKADTFIIDCEAVGFNPKTKKYQPFQEISQRIKRKYDIEQLEKELPIELNVFDILYYNGKTLINTPFKERRKIIEKIVKETPFKIRLAEQIITDSEKEAQKFYERALKEGQEGLMGKSLEGIYKPGARVGFGVKIKPEAEEFDLVITGAEWGTGKRAGWLTSFDVSCIDKSGNLLEIGKVSTGLKEKPEEGFSFEELTNLLKKLKLKEDAEGKHMIVRPEIVITVGYQDIQRSPTYSSGFALRFPRFKALRPDRSVHDIASIDEVRKEANRR